MNQLDNNTQLVYTVPQTAQLLNLSVHTIRAWIRDSKISPTRLGRRVMIEPQEVKRLIESGR